MHGAQKAWSGTALSSGGGDAAERGKLALLQGRPLNILAKLALFRNFEGYRNPFHCSTLFAYIHLGALARLVKAQPSQA